MSEQNQLIESLSNLPLTGCRFVSLSGYTSKGDGSVSNYTINAGINYGNAIKADEKFLSSYEVQEEDIEQLTKKLEGKDLKGKTPENLLIEAKEALLKSVRKETEDSKVRSEAQTAAYETVGPAIRRHKESGALSIYGLLRNKTVVKPSEKEKKVVNSRPLTVAKDHLSYKYLKKSKFRSLLLDHATIAQVNGETLILE